MSSNSQAFSMKDQKCEQVVVYQDRAEVKRSLSAKLVKGENEILLNNVSSFIDQDSVRVEGSGDATVVDVVCQSKQVKTDDVKNNEKAKKLLDEIKSLEFDKDKLDSKKSRFIKQQDTLNKFALSLATPSSNNESNQSHLANSKDNVESFFGFLDSYTNRLEYLDEELSKLNKEIDENNEKINVARENYNKLNVYDYNQAIEIKILIESKSDNANVNLILSYIVYQASWTPKYDIRVFGKEKKMIVNYFGMISQTTGEDWTDTKISLSTAVPSIGGNVPELNAENVRIKPKYECRPMPKIMRSMRKGAPSFGAKMEADVQYEMACSSNFMAMEEAPLEMMEAHVTTSDIGSTSTFEIPRVATIPSDNETHKVSIAIINLEPELEYECVPRKNALAYIKAKVTNKSQYALLAGPANIFLDNNFVAKTHASKSYSPGEEFEYSLGVDPAVKVTYKPIKKFKSQTGMLSKFTLTTFEQVIEIKNTTQVVAKVLLKDSVPLSNDDKISVKIIEPNLKNNSDVTLTKLNILEYKLNLKSGQSEEINIKYSIEHPSSEEVDFF